MLLVFSRWKRQAGFVKFFYVLYVLPATCSVEWLCNQTSFFLLKRSTRSFTEDLHRGCSYCTQWKHNGARWHLTSVKILGHLSENRHMSWNDSTWRYRTEMTCVWTFLSAVIAASEKINCHICQMCNWIGLSRAEQCGEVAFDCHSQQWMGF